MPLSRSEWPDWVMTARGELRRDEPMARHTTWRVGGPADWYYRPEDLPALTSFLHALPLDVPVTWVGLGSNLLVRDGGVRGVVISPRPMLTELTALADGHGVLAGAGVACARIARHCGRRGLGPAAFFAGIPGTLGGALAMNAGAWGHETWEVVRAVRTVDRRGNLHARSRDAFNVGYRQVTALSGQHEPEWFIDARLQFETLSTPEDLRGLLVRRKETQPLGLPSCGSVFRNPPDDHAARLIEACGLKGKRLGGAEVSAKHANFIINTGAARASDVEQLIEEVKSVVRSHTGVALHPEVRVIGEAQP